LANEVEDRVVGIREASAGGEGRYVADQHPRIGIDADQRVERRRQCHGRHSGPAADVQQHT
jgi:hypothetical protein